MLLSPAFVAFSVLTILAIDDSRREWMWATYQYHEALLLVAVLAAACACWDSQAHAKLEDIVASSPRAFASWVRVWSGSFGVATTIYAFGAIVTWLRVLVLGRASDPWIRPALSMIPAIAVIALFCTFGVAVGARFRQPFMAPIAGIAAFGAFVASLSVSELLLSMGGSGSAMFSNTPRIDVLAMRTLLGGSLTALGLGMLPSVDRLRPWLAGAALTALAAFTYLLTGNSQYAQASPTVTCVGAEPSICFAEAYADLEPGVRREFAPFFARLRTAGLPLPNGYSQDPNDLTRVTLDPLGFDADIAASMVVNGFADKRTCSAFADRPTASAWSDLVTFVRRDDNRVSAEQARAAIELLRQCSAR